jgi:hypothetical protein
MGVLLRTSQSKTTAIETLDHNRLPMSVGLRSLEFATSVNKDVTRGNKGARILRPWK